MSRPILFSVLLLMAPLPSALAREMLSYRRDAERRALEGHKAEFSTPPNPHLLEQALSSYDLAIKADELSVKDAINQLRSGRSITSKMIQQNLLWITWLGRVQFRLGRLVEAADSYLTFVERLKVAETKDVIFVDDPWFKNPQLARQAKLAERLNQEARAFVATKKSEWLEDLRRSHLEPLDGALERAIESTMTKAELKPLLLLARGRIKLLLGQLEAGLALLEQFQRDQGSPGEPELAKLRAGFEEILASADVNQEGQTPRARARTSLLKGRAHVALFRIEHPTDAHAESAVDLFEAFRKPDPGFRRGRPPAERAEQDTYRAAAKAFEVVYQARRSDLPRLPLFIGRSYFLAGEPKLALKWHEPWQADLTEDEARRARYLREEGDALGTCRTRCKILIGVGAGVAAIGLGVGLGLGLGLHHDSTPHQPW